VLKERANVIDFVHIVAKYNNHNDVITYGNFNGLMCFTSIFF